MPNKKIISTEHAPKAIGPYSQGIVTTQAQKVIYLSGQIGIDPKSGKVELCSENVETQTHQAMKNIKAALKEVEFNLENIIKSTIYLTSMEDFEAVNEVYASYFFKDFPARSTISVKALPLNALVEIECIASD